MFDVSDHLILMSTLNSSTAWPNSSQIGQSEFRTLPRWSGSGY